MADLTKIEWTGATINFWWGCTKVGPGCDNCYAEAWDKRTGGAHFGLGTPRRWIKSAAERLEKLNRIGGKWVFIQSMSDLFDKEVPLPHFFHAWASIEAASNCKIQIVTKRISMVEKRLSAIAATDWPDHAGLIVTVCNQDEADRDIPRLLAIKAQMGIPWVGLSMEPLLGPVKLRKEWLAALDWVIVGGESGPHARPMDPQHARDLRDQCVAAGVSFFFKQWGEWLPFGQSGFTAWHAHTNAKGDTRKTKGKWWGHAYFNDGAGGRNTHAFGPVETMIIDNRGTQAVRIGKARAGRLLDGRTWDQMPGVQHG